MPLVFFLDDGSNALCSRLRYHTDGAEYEEIDCCLSGRPPQKYWPAFTKQWLANRPDLQALATDSQDGRAPEDVICFIAALQAFLWQVHPFTWIQLGST